MFIAAAIASRPEFVNRRVASSSAMPADRNSSPISIADFRRYERTVNGPLVDRVARIPLARREMRQPESPAIAVAVRYPDVRRRPKRIAPVREAATRKRSAPFVITSSHQAKSVFIESHPQVQPMLLNAIGHAPSRCSFPAEPPSHLVDGHVVTAMVFWAGEFKSGSKCGTAATHDCDTKGFPRAGLG